MLKRVTVSFTIDTDEWKGDLEGISHFIRDEIEDGWNWAVDDSMVVAIGDIPNDPKTT